MCGIAGIFSTTQPSSETIRKMTSSLAHRGPDADGYFVNDHAALGHRRLSVLDLDERSHQPFFSHNRRYVTVFNGEIYNFRKIAEELHAAGVALKTTSDTEVLIESFVRWGVGFVHKLVGMFAFVIYDTLENKAFFFRDRVGKKPIYYYQQDGLFLFASEIKSILTHPALASSVAINTSTISDFLQLGYIPQPNTFYQDVYKFPAGHYGILEVGSSVSLLPYWNLPHYIRTSRTQTTSSAFSSLKELVTEAVQARLVADVPVGVFLSGGIDSSLVAAVAAKTTKLKSFSIGFKESKFDESEYARKVAQYIGTDHYSYTVQERDAVELVEEYVQHFDEPFADTSAIPTMLVSKLARKEVTVALTGDGGDELFLGYGAYTWAKRLNSPWWKLASPLLKQVLSAMPSSRWKRIAHLFTSVDPASQRKHIFSQEQYFFTDEEVHYRLLTDESMYKPWLYDDFRYLSVLSDAERQALFDFQFYLRDDLLVKVDRASMYYGLECRSPLLDHRLAEFSVNLPEDLKKANGISKVLLRKMLYELVPEKFFDRPKWGFSVPLSQWLKRDLNYLLDYLSEEQLQRTKVFNTFFVRNLVGRFLKGEDYLYNRLWTLIIVQKFLLRK
jgi:asparagine synthase (glutamine-hydrolysing)